MPGKPRFNTDAMRALVRARVDESSLRAVADEIGISRGGLESFLNGRSPYTKTRMRLAAWQMRQRDPNGTIARDEAEAAMALLGRYIESAETKAIRARRIREIADRLLSDA